MDAAEAWLREHDPEYETTKAGWKNLVDGEYVTPWQEFPAGTADDIQAIAESGRGSYILDTLPERYCPECGRSFMPYKGDHLYCSRRHQKRSTMRAYRRRRARP